MQAEIDVINASWNVGATSNGLADSVGLMVYEGTQVLVELVDEGSSLREPRYWKNCVEKRVIIPKALQYVKNYAEGSSQWEGFPIKVPANPLLSGCVCYYHIFSYFYYICLLAGGCAQNTDFARQQRIRWVCHLP